MIYQGEQLEKISFPLGGIGTGCIGLGGNGRLAEFEIFNRPAMNSPAGYSHIAVRAEDGERVLSSRVLAGDYTIDLAGMRGGADVRTMAGFPHFSSCGFDGAFPVAQLSFSDPGFPGGVRMTAFNPFIPHDDKNSSIPAAFFEISFENNGEREITYSAAFSLENHAQSSRNREISEPGCSGVTLCDAQTPPEDPGYGDMTLLCRAEEISTQCCWYRGAWMDQLEVFWRDLAAGGKLPAREYDTPGAHDTATVVGRCTVPPGGRASVRFLLSWSYPNCYNYWEPCKDSAGRDVTWKNHYATIFADSRDCARYAMEHWDGLFSRTERFRRALWDSTLDPVVLDAVASNLAVLKSPVVLRLENGAFWGWEGVFADAGSCEGTCQHVYNYAYALAFLFPKLERSIRELEFRYSTEESGKTNFRIKLPLGREGEKFRACLDGQMGCVIKTYREWKISGDGEWLRAHFPTVASILDYAASPENPDTWDGDGDGILEGRQHHTLDMELFGPSAWLEGIYLAALRAGCEMARFCGDAERLARWEARFARGQEFLNRELYNGDYYIQKLELSDRSPTERFSCPEYYSEELGELKYQIGDGCDIDQLCGQWHAGLCGLGEIFDPAQARSALCALWKHNFKPSLREFVNPWRLFALGDEGGAIMCAYPEGVRRPAIPLTYAQECMSGFEYQLAGLFFSFGMREEGLALVRAIRSRYDGKKRNPWSELECGASYARSMASYALLPILSGFSFDLPRGELGFAPATDKRAFRCFFSVGEAFGVFCADTAGAQLSLCEGTLSLSRLRLPFAAGGKQLFLDGVPVSFSFADGVFSFADTVFSQTLKIVF